MIATAVILLTLAGVALVAQQHRIERMESRYERLSITHSRTCHLLAKERKHHLACAVRAVKAERALERSDAALVEAGREAATHAGHLTAVMDAVAEGKPLSLVKGGRHG